MSPICRQRATIAAMRTAALALLALALTGCGTETSPPSAAQAAVETAPAPIAGPATEPAVVGGVTVELASATAGPAESWVQQDIPGHTEWLVLEVRYTATTDPVPIDDANLDLFYGANRTPANEWVPSEPTAAPTQVTPGEPATITHEYSAPAGGLDELTATVMLNGSTWTFEGVDELLRAG